MAVKRGRGACTWKSQAVDEQAARFVRTVASRQNCDLCCDGTMRATSPALLRSLLALGSLMLGPGPAATAWKEFDCVAATNATFTATWIMTVVQLWATTARASTSIMSWAQPVDTLLELRPHGQLAATARR